MEFNNQYFRYVENKINYIRLNRKNTEDIHTKTISIKRILFASHNSRMRCFVESVIPSEVYKAYKAVDPHNSAYRFKNCATLCVSFFKDNPYAKLELIFSGHLDDRSRQSGMYYITPKDTPTSDHDRVFHTIEVPCKNLGIDSSSIKCDYEIYIVRHGESEHNVKTYYSKPLGELTGTDMEQSIKNNKLDTELTPNGITETKKAADALIDYLSEKNARLDQAFCSILQRTRQTISIMLGRIRERAPHLINQINKMIIAPCSREIKYGDVRGCFIRDPEPAYFDDPKNKEKYRFNQPKCAYLEGDEDMDPECKIIGGIEIDPTYYIDYHKNSKCSGLSTNMASVIVEIVEITDQL